MLWQLESLEGTTRQIVAQASLTNSREAEHTHKLEKRKLVLIIWCHVMSLTPTCCTVIRPEAGDLVVPVTSKDDASVEGLNSVAARSSPTDVGADENAADRAFLFTK